MANWPGTQPQGRPPKEVRVWMALKLTCSNFEMSWMTFGDK